MSWGEEGGLMRGPRGEGGVVPVVLGGRSGSYDWSQVWGESHEWS